MDLDQPQPRSGIGRTLIVAFLVLCAMTLFAVYGSGSHFGNLDNTFEATPASTTRLADAIVRLNLDPELSDETLRAVAQAVMDRAAQGDVEAAAFVFELAARQRAATDDAEQPHPQNDRTRLARSECP